MSLGPSFINLFDTPEAGRSPDELLEDALAARVDPSRPSTFWVSRVVLLGGTHTLPPSVILAFAPGARLIVAKRFTLWGILDAGLEARFELVGEGVVELLGPLDEIVADWWLPSLGRTAVELALAALWTRYLHEGVLPAPIRLDGPYSLTRTLRVLPPGELTGRVDVVLRGQHGCSLDPPTFIVGSGAPAEGLSSLVSVEEAVVLTLEHVAFDAGPRSGAARAHACLSLEGTFHGSRIEACSFRFGGAGIRVIPGLQHWTEVLGASGTAEGLRLALLGLAIGRSTTSSNRLVVSRCLFVGASVGSGAIEGARGIDIGFGAPTALDLRDSQFVGSYVNAVSILGGQADVTACHFANELPFEPGSPETSDLLVQRWGGDDIHFETTVPLKPAPTLGVIFYRPTPINVYRGHALANTHLTVTHCVSTSPTFLVMNQAFPYADTILGGAVLTNVRHTPAVAGRVSVHLGAGAPPRGLMLQGCRFGGSVVCESGSLSDTVVDLGTRFIGEAAFRGTIPLTLSTGRHP